MVRWNTFPREPMITLNEFDSELQRTQGCIFSAGAERWSKLPKSILLNSTTNAAVTGILKFMISEDGFIVTDQRITRLLARPFLPGIFRAKLFRAKRWAGLVMLAVLSAPVFASTITVTTTADSGPGSLREAITNASSGDTINFSVTGTIALGSELLISQNLTINGPGATSLAISGNNTTYRVFEIAGGTVALSGLTVQNGSIGGGGRAAAVFSTNGAFTVQCTDGSGNSTTKTVTVNVPHNSGH